MNMIYAKQSLMTLLFFVVLSFVVLSLLLLSDSRAQETGPTVIERELIYLNELWPGDYDNQEQVSLDARASGVDETELPRFHAEVTRLSMPSLGENVFYVEKRRDDDSSKIHSQHVYHATADNEANAIRLSAYRIKPNSTNVAADKLRKRQLTRLSGCDILLRRDGDSFAGQTVAAECDQELEKGTHIERFMRISAEQYSFNDRRVNADGEYSADFKSRNMERARWFACMVDVPKKVEGVSNHTQHYIKLHDQGGQFNFTHPDGRDLVVLMRNTWSYGMHRETFFVGVFEGTVKGKLLVYSWGQPGSDRIGLNPGYVRIQCDLDTPENVKLQKGLRVAS